MTDENAFEHKIESLKPAEALKEAIDFPREARVRIENALSTMTQFLGELERQEHPDEARDEITDVFTSTMQALQEFAEHLPANLAELNQSLIDVCDDVLVSLGTADWREKVKTYAHCKALVEKERVDRVVEVNENMADEDFDMLQDFDLQLKNKYSGFQPRLVNLVEGNIDEIPAIREVAADLVGYIDSRISKIQSAVGKLKAHPKKIYRELTDGFSDATEPFMKKMKEAGKLVLERTDDGKLNASDIRILQRVLIELRVYWERYKVVADKVGDSQLYRYYREVERPRRLGGEAEIRD